MGVISIAAAGMRAGAMRLDAAASSVAGLSGIEAIPPVAAAPGAQADGNITTRLTLSTAAEPAEALIEAMEAGFTYRANAKVMRMADGMIGALLDKSA